MCTQKRSCWAESLPTSPGLAITLPGWPRDNNSRFVSLLSCLYTSEEQFILSQVALLEQVDTLLPMLDSASIQGTSAGLQLCCCCLGSWVDEQNFPVPQVPRVQAGFAHFYSLP